MNEYLLEGPKSCLEHSQVNTVSLCPRFLWQILMDTDNYRADIRPQNLDF